MPLSDDKNQGVELGSLETKVMGIVRYLGKASARDVLRELRDERDLAYTTISTTLDRLYRKGMLKRSETKSRGGTTYIYSVVPDEQIQRQVVKWSIDRLLEAFGPAIVSKIYERLEEIPKSELESLKKKVERARVKQVGG